MDVDMNSEGEDKKELYDNDHIDAVEKLNRDIFSKMFKNRSK